VSVRETILITGASSGLGAGLAREFAARGRRLALCARRLDRLEALRDELVSAHPGLEVRVRRLDVNDHAAVAEVFHAFRDDFGRIDRVIVNAGIGKGQPVGRGRFDINRQTAMTNFVGALAQCEAAMEIFRAQGDGHLVVMSSVASLRAARGNGTVYAASKAGLSALAQGIRSDVMGSDIVVSTMLPGFIRSEMNERVKRTPFIVDTETGCRALAAAIEREPVRAVVPRWPWALIATAMHRLPLRMTRRFG
jgi:short-subunit dehydrogenase